MGEIVCGFEMSTLVSVGHIYTLHHKFHSFKKSKISIFYLMMLLPVWVMGWMGRAPHLVFV